MSIDGILNIDKPPGRTSFSVVAQVRRWSGERRVGHAGTLDPAATGVLLVCLSQATRVISILAEARKTYRAQVELGAATDTYDGEGMVTQRGDHSLITREQVEAALGPFRGLIRQIPPMYSAVKYQGRPLYRLARAGIEVPRKERRAEVYRLELIEWQPPLLTLEVECGKGTYIRTLAHDLGQVLGCGAYLKGLARLRVGTFSLEDAVALPQLERAFTMGYWRELLHPIDSVLTHLPAAVVAESVEQAIRHGQGIILGAAPQGETCRAYSMTGQLIALLRFCPESGMWQPSKVFLPLDSPNSPKLPPINP